MKAFLFPLAVLASSAAAQTTTACAADYIVEACLGSEKAKLAACKSDDYACQCAGWKNVITCFNNCPNDPRQHESAGQRDIFCNYVTQFASSSTTAPSQTSLSPAVSTGDANTTGNEEAANQSGGSTTTTSSRGPASTNHAADLVLNAGGVLAAVAGVAAAML